MTDLVICEICGTSFYTNSSIEVCQCCQTVKKIKSTKAKHPYSNLKLQGCKDRLKMLLNNQKNSLQYSSGLNTEFLKQFIEKAEKALSQKTKKADLLDLMTLSLEVSHDLTAQQKAKR